MTFYTQLGENGELKLPAQVLEQIGAQRFEVNVENGKVILSPVQQVQQYGVAWRNLTPAERAADFMAWMQRIETDETREANHISDEDLRRENMYDDRI